MGRYVKVIYLPTNGSLIVSKDWYDITIDLIEFSTLEIYS